MIINKDAIRRNRKQLGAFHTVFVQQRSVYTDRAGAYAVLTAILDDERSAFVDAIAPDGTRCPFEVIIDDIVSIIDHTTPAVLDKSGTNPDSPSERTVIPFPRHRR